MGDEKNQPKTMAVSGVFMVAPPGTEPALGQPGWVDLGDCLNIDGVTLASDLPADDESIQIDHSLDLEPAPVVYEFTFGARTGRRIRRMLANLDGIYRLPGDKALIHHGRRIR